MILQILFFILSVLLAWFSFRSFRGGIEYLRYFRDELAKPRSGWEPMTTIIAPCKGVDEGMLANFEALLRQDLPEFEVVFVIDDPDDPAAEVIETVAHRVGRQAKIVVAPEAVTSSQKVENLREGVLHVDPKSEVFVFVDSDARPAAGWLRALTAPLEDDTIGAATGYRWFIAEPSTFAGELRAAWNASIASALGPNEKSNFCWGGSTAIRRSVFERLGVREHWQGTLSDDFTLTRIVRNAGLRIKFVPLALTASVASCTFRELLEFSTRQMKITRVYATPLWVISFVGSGIFVGVMVSAIGFAIFAQPGSVFHIAALVTLATVISLSVGKSLYRLRAVELALQENQEKIRRQTIWQLTMWPAAQLLFFINCVLALFSRRVKWRGIEYEMLSERQTRRL
jgi:ceramide glucosyltransferase